jgi:hypothetical protein
MIFSVIDDTQAGETMQVLDTILGCSHGKSGGIAFTITIDAAIGVCKEP